MDNRALAIYTRVSTSLQEKEATIETQKYDCRIKAAETDGGHVVEFADDGYTGSTLVRPGLDQLRAECRAGHIKAVLLHAPDRLARDRFLYQLVLREWKELGIAVQYHHYTVEDSPQGRLLDDVLGSFSQFEREMIIDRTRRGRERKIKEGGMWRSRPPYGYRYVQLGGGEGYIELVPEQVPLVRQIFDWLLAGKSLYWLTNELNARGHRTAYGSPWNYAVVHRMIHNPMYHGVVVHNRFCKAPVKRPRVAYRKGSGAGYTQRPREEWVENTPLAADGSPRLAIVDAATQERCVQQLITNRTYASRNADYVYLLSGLLYCGNTVEESGAVCGRRLVGGGKARDGSERTALYNCSRRLETDKHKPSKCKNKHQVVALEALVWDWVIAQTSDPAKLRDHLHLREDTQSLRRRDADTLVAQMAARLAGVDQKLALLMDMLLDQQIDRTTMLAKQAFLVAERDKVRATLTKATAELSALGAEQIWDVDAFSAHINAALDDLTHVPEKEQRLLRQKLLRKIIRRIEITPERVVIYGMFDGVLSLPDCKSMTLIIDSQYPQLVWTLPLPFVGHVPHPSMLTTQPNPGQWSCP